MIRRFLFSDYSEIIFNNEEDRIILETVFTKIQHEIDVGKIHVGRTKGNYDRDSFKIVDYFNNRLYTQGIVGVFRTSANILICGVQKEYVVEVVLKSRFDDDFGKPYFLANMLECSELYIGNEMSGCSYDEVFDFLLVALFKVKFLEAYQTGFYKAYQTYHEGSFKPRGRIDFVSIIKNIGNQNSSIPYTYTERSYQNPLNHLIVASYHVLKKKFPRHIEILIDSTDTKNILDYLMSESNYVETDFKRLISLNIKNIIHPLYSAYEELRVLCLRVLRQEGLSPFEFENGESEAILYYIPDLWEEYLQIKLFNNIQNNIFDIKEQEKLRVVNHLTIRPDFVVFRKEDNKPFAVFDAKFKPHWGQGEFDLDDYTKCIRDMNAFDTHITGVMFPSKNAIGDIVTKNSISNFNLNDVFIRLKILLPTLENNSYQAYSKILDSNVFNAGKKLYEELVKWRK